MSAERELERIRGLLLGWDGRVNEQESTASWVSAALAGAAGTEDALRRRLEELVDRLHEEAGDCEEVRRARAQLAHCHGETLATRESEAMRTAAVRAAAELRHAYRPETRDWRLVARAIELLERATTKEQP